MSVFTRRSFCAASIVAGGCAPRLGAGAGQRMTLEDARSVGATGFQLLDNRIFVDVWINEAGPFAFIFDTGGANVLAPHVVDQLGLARRDAFAMTGAGGGSEQAWRVDVETARIGPTVSRNVAFTTFSLASIQRAIGFSRLDGLFGHELLQRFVVAVDYDRSELTFAEPTTAPTRILTGERLPISFAGHLPIVDAVIDGFPVRALIDTGDRSSVTLLTPFVEREGLRARYRPSFRGVTGWGVGGPIIADVARVPNLQLGTTGISRVVARMAAPGMGAFSGDNVEISIGTGVMKRFGVTFDYGARQMILRPGAGVGTADPLDRAGAWLTINDNGPGFRVASVVHNGPAAQAGLREGDVIVAVNEVEASRLDLLELRAQLSAPAGLESVSFGLLGGSEAVVWLRDLLEPA